MNAYIDCQENLWAAVAATGESWQRILQLKQIIHPLFDKNADLPLSDPNHPGNLYGKANDLEGNVTRMYTKVREILDANLGDYSELLKKIFTEDSDSDSENGVSLIYYTVSLINQYMAYIAMLNGNSDASDSD
jgi:hypothetical protein